MLKKALVCGSSGFIGHHLTAFLKKKNFYVIGVDKNLPAFENKCDEFHQTDLSNYDSVSLIISKDIDCIYQLAADMGGAGYIFTGENDAEIMSNSASININILKAMVTKNIKKIFFSSSACIYPEHNQLDIETLTMSEDSAYPANPDSNYGWEKLFSERLYQAYARNHGLDVKIGRFHNIYGPYCHYDNGKEKSIAALCRKISLAKHGGEIEIWGSGQQKRSFLYIDDCLTAVDKLMESNFSEPINIGSEEIISINSLASMIESISNKKIVIKNVPGPVGVNTRTSDNKLIYSVLDWRPSVSLEEGIQRTYNWINKSIVTKE